MAEPRVSSEAFAAAVDRLCAHRARPVVVKLGGSAMEDPVATDACLRSVATLNRLGVPVVLVHGGGKPIDRAMAEAGITPRKVAGRRYTDDATLEIVVRVLHQIMDGLDNAFERLGVQSVGLEKSVLTATMMTLPGSPPIDLGHVGAAVRVDVPTLREVLAGATVPIIPSLAHGADGGWLNVNADTAAAAVAGALKADMAIFLTDTPGVLRDRSDPKSLIPQLTESECRDLIASGVIDGGMVPKVEACFEALDAGATSALILDGRVPYSLLDVFLHDTFTGTAITR